MSEKYAFTSFEQCVDVLDKSRYVNIRIFGDVEFPKGKTVFSSNCEISGFENARIIFPENSSIIVRNSSFIVRNSLLEHKGFSSRQSSFIELQHSVLDLSKCEVMTSFEKNGTLINSDKSVIVVSGLGFIFGIIECFFIALFLYMHKVLENSFLNVFLHFLCFYLPPAG